MSSAAADDEGLDGTPIKSVSSLRSRFENMGKNDPAPVPPSVPSTSPGVASAPGSGSGSGLNSGSVSGTTPVSPPTSSHNTTSSRSVSPARNSDRLPPPPPNARPPAEASVASSSSSSSSAPVPPPARPRDPSAAAATFKLPSQQGLPARSANSRAPPKPPVVTVQPPLSPSPGRVGADMQQEQLQYLNTETIALPVTTLRSPHNQTFPDQRRQSRPAGGKPPSPPPPRRSSETRRPPPPPINRADKPSVRSKPVLTDANGWHSALNKVPETSSVAAAAAKIETSPFSSPPRSAAAAAATTTTNTIASANNTTTSSSKMETSPFGSASSDDEEELPPPIPARPRPESAVVNPTLNRSKSLHVGSSFEPPPLHPSSLNRRRDREEAPTFTKPAALARQLTGPSVPPRPMSSIEPPPPPVAQRRPPPVKSAKPPPPKPPRPSVTTTGDSMSSNLNRQSYGPFTPQYQRPPVRGHQSHHSVIEGSTYADTRSPLAATPAPVPPPRVTPAPAPTPAITTASAPTPAPVAAASLQPMTPSVASTKNEPKSIVTAYPDITNVNRQSPFLKPGIPEITTKYDARVFDVCGERVVCGGSMTRAWSMVDGTEILMQACAEGVRGTAIAFKPAPNPNDEGCKVWVGTNFGELQEIDLSTAQISNTKPSAHNRQEIIRIYRYQNQLWTLDETGILHVWGPDQSTVPNLNNSPSYTYRIPRGHTFSMVVGNELWYACAKDVYVFAPTIEGNPQCQRTPRPLSFEGAGEIVCGTTLRSEPGKVFFGHSDGKVSIYSQQDFSLLSVVSLNAFKINTMGGVGDKLWAGFNSGKICVYDVSTSPWTMKKEWHAHDNPVIKLIPDASSIYRIGRYQVVSLGADNKLRAWDGLLKEDELDNQMRALDTEYCSFEDLDVRVLTWNAGASTPSQIQHSSDATFFQSLIQESGCPDIIVFGFQELVDLEDKTATAKRLFKSSKKKDDKKDMSHAYRDWRDFLQRTLDDYMPPNQPYYALHTATLVGLFTCIFVKASMRERIHDLYATDVKRGMGGYHGNKGAIVIRFMIDDSSLCFVNCHLAAGQSQANSRHNDVAAILESQILPIERNTAIRPDHYVGGGDGTMVMDHELVLWNGDLNYRIDAMSRDTVVMAVKSNNLAKLLERDQLLVAKRRNPSFKLRAFHESPIEFAPTYKYDVGTDTYDTSEKKRSPAWCDRLLHRGHGRIQQLEYRRHEVQASDHRPVSGRFKFYVKEIDHTLKATTQAKCLQRIDEQRAVMEQDEKLAYLTQVCGFDPATSNSLIQQRAMKRDNRSPSRNRDIVVPASQY
ncbi:hypothetical protein TD95_004885 [Thielaviopsis punctulata]|uniref:Inositol polyphosphate-related phosphatase domain-containing protein n=1 Tax=Thielaviopsis punctulata TaxID=72032 RepID=A0A0F4Z8G4_9PEZI|nr:hypothetical protein TD95_004885 [Thielaviopsis punctulata]